MTFNSLHFLIFFPTVLIIYFGLPFRFRWIFLLAASYYFYACWKWTYLLIVLASSSADFAAGLWLEKTDRSLKRRLILGAALIFNLGILFFLKYYNFFQQSVAAPLFGFTFPYSHWLLPIGISFHTFQSMGYSIDVYRKRIPAERSLPIFFLYVTFFPQLVAGPIERGETMLGQFKKDVPFDPTRVRHGCQLMLWGLFKKMVIADRLALYVDSIYLKPELANSFDLALATLVFGYQIYCDFSGYCDIALGAAEALGLRLTENFKNPTRATSISDFWKRWHISLSTWFRDYVYIPLGGNRNGGARWTFNIFVTFLLSGLWHGANWTFVIWGGLHGAFLVIEKIGTRFKGKIRLPIFFKWVSTMLAVNVAWVFFRAPTVDAARFVLSGIVKKFDVYQWMGSGLALFERGLKADNLLLISILLIVFLEVIQTLQGRFQIREKISGLPQLMRWGLYVTVVLGLINFGVEQTIPFIYFQF